MPFSISHSYQTFVVNPSAAYKTQTAASREKQTSRFKTDDGDTVNISEEAYALLETNVTAGGGRFLRRDLHTDRN